MMRKTCSVTCNINEQPKHVKIKVSVVKLSQIMSLLQNKPFLLIQIILYTLIAYRL